MCGIVGYLGSRPVVPLLLGGLKKLEYRGYDSAGVAVAGNGHGLVLRRAQGKLAQLEQLLGLDPPEGTYGIGHTRWATHGPPSERNSHPHTDCTRRIAIAHNGIIENYSGLKDRLRAAGHVFTSDTDTEVIAHLIETHLNGDLAAAVRKTVAELQGAFALTVISSEDPGKIVAARLGAPVIIGVGENESFVASDVLPVLPYTRRVVYLADGEMAVLRQDRIEFTDFAGTPHPHAPEQIHWDAQLAEKGGFRHFMQKEIYEQPVALRETLRGRVKPDQGRVCLCELGAMAEELSRIERVHLIACGTSLHAGLVGKWMMESLAGVPAEVDHASEYRYRDPLVDRRTLGVLISQSGETADTLAAGREAREKGARTLAITNVPASTLTRESDATLLTHAGPEVGVAATKTFSAQLVSLLLLAVEMAQRKGRLGGPEGRQLLDELARIPARLEQLLQRDDVVEAIARRFYRARDFLFLGRGLHYPIALEGALKLKEISYIHAEGYPAGEMKHGPNALIDGDLPVVFLATYQPDLAASELRYQKTLSNMEEVKARDGKVIGLLNEGDEEGRRRCDAVIEIPPTRELLLPLLAVVPLQLLAYHIAVLRGCDVDQPRNLAKSVTVE
ncbi:MAG: glutamine--fructose-6-phosphate transaminase (isomerizing) [Acidobacteria bacterium]|nr:glutamine--fructose-6-phosphate transaminase (isomerizing) [Acidobacteriota bacterium]